MSLCQVRLAAAPWFCGALAIGLIAMACGETDGGEERMLSENAGAGVSHSTAGDGALTGGSAGFEAGGIGGGVGSGASGSGSGGRNGASGSSGEAGSGASSGAWGSGGSGASTTGGAAGASGATAIGGCRVSTDCPYEGPSSPYVGPSSSGATTCLAPGQSPPGPAVVCGAPGWCGRCDCPPQPIFAGEGMPCESSDDCPAGDAEMRAASACVDGYCRECGTDEDCPGELPACIAASTFVLTRTCVECMTDLHCPAEKPHCMLAGSIGGVCWPCASSAECEVGICSAAGCVPACTDDTQCSDPLTRCTNQRCEAIDCSDSSVCPVHSECSDGVCRRTACALDADCADGFCVGSACHETLGTCFTQMFAP